MAGKNKGGGEGSKKAQGQSRKAEQASQKAAAEGAKLAAAEDVEWEKGAKKGNAKKAAAEEKQAEAARKKAEREALLAEEEKNTPGRSAPKNAKSATKKTKGLGDALGQLDLEDASLPTLNASGIDNALDALIVGTGESKVAKIDKHPERRRAKAFEAWMERVGNERDEEMKGQYNKSQRKQRLWEEFLRSPDNPENQIAAQYNATREELRQMQAEEKRKIEERLGSK